MIKKLAGSIREYKKASLLTPVFVIGEVILEVTIPLLMANLIDYGIDAGNMTFVMKMGVALLLCTVFTILFGVLAGRYAAVASAGLACNLRQDMFYDDTICQKVKPSSQALRPTESCGFHFSHTEGKSVWGHQVL